MKDAEKTAWERVVRSAKENGYVDVSRGFGADDGGKEIDAILVADSELKRLREAVAWAIGIMEGLPWDEMTTADYGGDQFIQDFRRRVNPE